MSLLLIVVDYMFYDFLNRGDLKIDFSIHGTFLFVVLFLVETIAVLCSCNLYATELFTMLMMKNCLSMLIYLTFSKF